jgi:DNA topoisomerase I
MTKAAPTTKAKAQAEEDYSLVIVESPAKAKTIGKILGSNYKIESSVGHIRDLPVRGIGVNTRKDFEPTYEIMPGKEKVVEKLLSIAKNADMIYLATDPDREGEAIAWHLSCILDAPKKKVKRVKFNEITETAVREAFINASEIDKPRVEAQQARRILDRLVGYKVSPLIQRKIGGRSAGRVQSVAVRLICAREAEIVAFNPEEYWSFNGLFEKDKFKFNAQLNSFNGKKIVTPDKAEKNDILWIKSAAEAKELEKELKIPQSAKIKSVNERTINKQSSPPFITSTLQRAAASVFGFGVKKTMQIAQQLYEGIDLYGGNAPVGLITYMRTDSTRISDKAVEEAEVYITKKYGKDFLPKEKRQFAKGKGAQDAHEAVRPTYIDKTKEPDKIKQGLSSDQYKLYKLIWERFLSSQMAQAKLSRTTVEVEDKDAKAIFKASATKTIFAGFQAVFKNNIQEQENADEATDDGNNIADNFPDFKKGDLVNLSKFLSKQHFTEPPPRFNEASLVKTLEELGIGRPSTYSSIISTVLDRKYVEKNENKNLVPTELGKKVNTVLIENFGNIFESTFTAHMESQLDEIEHTALNWKKMLADFYTPFKVTLKEAQTRIETQQTPTDIDCEKCDAKMMIKSGRFGPFLGCANYPTCDSTMRLDKDGQVIPPAQETETECPKCTSKMMITRGRFGDYLLCSNEECKHKMPIIKSIGIKCPKEGCEGEIVEKKSRFGKMFYGCTEWSNTACDAVFWNRPIAEDCPDCKSTLTYKNLKRGDKIACPVKTCGYERLATDEDKIKYKVQVEESAKPKEETEEEDEKIGV